MFSDTCLPSEQDLLKFRLFLSRFLLTQRVFCRVRQPFVLLGVPVLFGKHECY